MRFLYPVAITCLGILFATTACANSPSIALDTETAMRCLKLLRDSRDLQQFWPAMHAAEALTLAGHGPEVIAFLAPLLESETDGQRRCGLARELVRAGDQTKVRVLLDLLAAEDPYAHVHACESLYKVNQIGDGVLLRQAFLDRSNAPKAIMAAAALARWGNGDALAYLRGQAATDDPDAAPIAAWVLARVGNATDIPVLRTGEARFDDPMKRGFFTNALASLGDPAATATLLGNLKHEVAAVRTYAAEFAGEIGLAEAREALIGLLEDADVDVRVRAAQSLLLMTRNASGVPDGMFAQDVFPATEANPRYSEGDILVLPDGRYLFATTEFIGDDSDFAKAHLVGRISADGGQSWEAPFELQENVGGRNVMSLTFQALSDSEMGLFFLRKNDFNDLDVYLRRSSDGGTTFGTPTLVTDAPGYHVLNNDRVIRLKNGRLLVPVASTPDVEKVNHFTCRVWISDDAGNTWRAGSGEVDYAQRGAMEPEVLELNDGRIIMIIRTQLGHIAASYSEDGGDTWTQASDWGVRAPEAPSSVRRIPSTGDLLLIWNDNFQAGAGHGGKRTPLTVAISKDEGKTWINKKNVETGEGTETFTSGYSYISAAFDQGRVLLSYYVAEDSTGRISSRFRSFPIGWLYE